MLTHTLLLPLETSEQLTPEEEAEETEAWAKPLSQLWQNRPPNFEAEKEFNETMAQQAPHCSVCMIFQTYHQVSLLHPLCLHRTSSQRAAKFNCGYRAYHWLSWERHVFLMFFASSVCWSGFSRQITQQCRFSTENALEKSRVCGLGSGSMPCAPWHSHCSQRNLLFCYHCSQ